MTPHVDRDNGYATFREGRSACIRLTGDLDAETARAIAAHLRQDRQSIRLRLECSALEHVDAAGARILSAALLHWSQGAGDRSVDILNLAAHTASRVALHPLVSFLETDEHLFIDPDRELFADPAGRVA